MFGNKIKLFVLFNDVNNLVTFVVDNNKFITLDDFIIEVKECLVMFFVCMNKIIDVLLDFY